MKRKFYYGLWFRLIMFVGITMIISLTIISLSYFLFINDEEIIRPGGGPIMFFVFFILFSVSLGTILAASIGRRFLKPVYELSRGTKEISKGNFDVRIDVNNRSEIGELGRSFNKMARELQNNQMIHSDFISNVSHEFNTPLSAILGYAMLIKDEELSKEEQDESLQKIISSSKRLSLLTSNILKLSKLENQEINVNQKEFSLDEQIREVILDLESEWEDKDILLEVDLADTSIYGEEELIAQVWYNTLHNAIKFSESNAKIEISLKNHSEQIIVTIKDYGKGMNEQTLNHIFDKFYQYDTSRSLEGNGLGLAIVKKIADLNNIIIDVESVENEGSTFKFIIKK